MLAAPALRTSTGELFPRLPFKVGALVNDIYRKIQVDVPILVLFSTVHLQNDSSNFQPAGAQCKCCWAIYKWRICRLKGKLILVSVWKDGYAPVGCVCRWVGQGESGGQVTGDVWTVTVLPRHAARHGTRPGCLGPPHCILPSPRWSLQSSELVQPRI
jgi:hypothetical protein